MAVPSNVVCPKCGNLFEYNKVNGMQLIEALQDIEARKRMHLRLALDTIELMYRQGSPPYALIKKVLLDKMNDYTRDITTILGLGEEVE